MVGLDRLAFWYFLDVRALLLFEFFSGFVGFGVLFRLKFEMSLLFVCFF